MPNNQLHQSKSPYLLQHADNPVAWMPWGTSAFERAKTEDKPIFLSIGYATCHWCHVMAHESFEDYDVATLLNDHFVSIKLDREERPDLDQLYMTVCQMMTGSGGWPLSVFLFPDKTPFFAGTYFPKHSQYGRIGFMDLLGQINEIWQSNRAQLQSSSQEITKALESGRHAITTEMIRPDILQTAFAQLRDSFDARYGGFGSAPKFPTPHQQLFLLRYAYTFSEPSALDMVSKTLTSMRLGGIYDHVALGFHRYSTDEKWLVPHFEKMLYDQAMLAMSYAEAYRQTGDRLYEQTCREILTYVMQDMKGENESFYCAEDADSEGEEGKFCVWTAAELDSLLSPSDGQWVKEIFQVTPGGNFHDEATHQLTGANILHLASPLAPEDSARWALIRTQLSEVRGKRVPPLKDTKQLADWNGLMIAALAKAGRLLSDPDYINQARRSMSAILTTFITDSKLCHAYPNSENAIKGMATDYAYVIWALLELYQADLDPEHLNSALSLQETMLTLFWDERQGGFFTNISEDLIVSQKESYDGALPAANSVALLNLIRLSSLTNTPDYWEKAGAILTAFSSQIQSYPSAYTFFMIGIRLYQQGHRYVTVVGDNTNSTTHDFLKGIAGIVDLDTDLRVIPASSDHPILDGKPTAYICQNFSCLSGMTDIKEIRDAINRVST